MISNYTFNDSNSQTQELSYPNSWNKDYSGSCGYSTKLILKYFVMDNFNLQWWNQEDRNTFEILDFESQIRYKNKNYLVQNCSTKEKKYFIKTFLSGSQNFKLENFKLENSKPENDKPNLVELERADLLVSKLGKIYDSLDSDMRKAENSQEVSKLGKTYDSLDFDFDMLKVENSKVALSKLLAISKSEYEREIDGIKLLRQVPGIKSPTIKVEGRLINSSSRHYIAVMEELVGKSLQFYYKNVGQQPSSDKREEAFQQLQEAVTACGKGLAQLHTFRKGQKQSLSEEFKKSILADLKDFQSWNFGVDLEGLGETLEKYVNDVVNKVEKEFYTPGCTHGDVKLIHTFYDSNSKDFSLINLHQISEKGIPAQDYYNFILSLVLNRYDYSLNEKICKKRQREDEEEEEFEIVEKKLKTETVVLKKELLIEKEVKCLIENFELAYQKAGGEIPTKAYADLFLLRHRLRFLLRRDVKLANIPEPHRTRLKDLLKLSVQHLRASLIEFKPSFNVKPT